MVHEIKVAKMSYFFFCLMRFTHFDDEALVGLGMDNTKIPAKIIMVRYVNSFF